jgi:glucose-6-phosphate 1-dehydrogenase
MRAAERFRAAFFFRNVTLERPMTSQTIPVDPFDLIVFGGTGDLSERKLLPALYQRQKAGQFSEPTRPIATSPRRRSAPMSAPAMSTKAS